VHTWGKSFVVLDMRMVFQPSEAIWVRAVASEDETTLRFDAPRR
jgi:hypothetical protein